MSRFIVLVLDSFGVGAMDDVVKDRPQDLGANTYQSVLSSDPNVKLPTLEALGIANAAGLEVGKIHFSNTANYGVSNLKHFGCDTFYGHQELMGTEPKKPLEEPFQKNINHVESVLKKEGYQVSRYFGPDSNSKKMNPILVVNGCVTIGDNLEADLGQVYNIVATLDLISYEDLLKMGQIVRSCVKVPRVIAFGGEEVTLNEIKNAYESIGNFAGVHAPKTGVYRKGYRVQHMGYGIDATKQLPTIIGEKTPVVLIGKVADIVENPYGYSIPAVETTEVMRLLKSQIEENRRGFICANVQETDLAGHAQDSQLYLEKLKIVDCYLKEIIDLLTSDDILIITADHGNDPNIGHAQHTREKVPLLVYKRGLKSIHLGTRNSLADIGQTAADYFNNLLPDNGVSFLEALSATH